MYPFLRLAWEFWEHRKGPPLPPHGVHVSHHRCWPWDIDPWVELNNGRTLTLYDLGRLPMARRMGLIPVLRDNGWGLTMAGASVRYRRRVRPFQKFQMRSCAVGFDARFIYLEQSMWRGETCCNQILYRSAVTGPKGIIPPAEVMAAWGVDPTSPPLPDWVQNWIAAEDSRPWPPEIRDNS